MVSHLNVMGGIAWDKLDINTPEKSFITPLFLDKRMSWCKYQGNPGIHLQLIHIKYNGNISAKDRKQFKSNFTVLVFKKLKKTLWLHCWRFSVWECDDATSKLWNIMICNRRRKEKCYKGSYQQQKDVYGIM